MLGINNLVEFTGVTMGQKKAIKGASLSLKIMLLSTLSGCSIYDENYMMRVATPPNYDEINQYVKEWNEAKPTVARLSVLEHDLALIIKQVDDKLSALTNHSSQHANNIHAGISNGDSASMPLLPDEANNVDSIRQNYAAHLAFFLKEDSARGGWLVLKRRYPEILEGLTPVVKKVIRNQQTIYSLRVGPFDGEVGANEICSIFNHYKYKCEPSEFNGNTI